MVNEIHLSRFQMLIHVCQVYSYYYYYLTQFFSNIYLVKSYISYFLFYLFFLILTKRHDFFINISLLISVVKLRELLKIQIYLFFFRDSRYVTYIAITHSVI